MGCPVLDSEYYANIARESFCVLYPENSQNQLVSSKDRLGNTATFEYDGFGRQTAVIIPNGLRQESVYDSLSRVISSIFNDGTASLTTSYALNFEGRATAQVLPDGTTESFNYTNGLLASFTDKAGKVWTYSYTSSGELDTVVAPDGIGLAVDYDYNDKGQVAKVTNSEGVLALYDYDTLGRVIKAAMPDNTFSQFEHGPAGETAQIDRSGRRTGIAYDTYGRRTSVTDPKSQVTGFDYNLAGDLTKLTDANTNQTNWQFDGEGNVTKKIYADNSNYEYSYDKNGWLISRKDAKGAETLYSYNNIGQLTTVNYPNDADVSFTYDGFGRRTNMADTIGSTTWTYNNTGLVLSESSNGGSALAATVSYTYDSAGRKASMSVAGKTILYSYDSLGRLSSLRSPSA
ncbi:MAG: hypothetical protein Q8O19_02525, partial [Rectinemataceae bacterium]|nr:hypothetical protein [Rectinemataceae bacterium]